MKSDKPTWTDHTGRQWPLVTSKNPLKFRYPSHAALRAYVFHRDGYKCVRCQATAISVPDGYDGSTFLAANTSLKDGSSDMLVVDHIITLRGGGSSVPSNLQTLCETCNKAKQPEDRAAISAFKESGYE